MKKVLLFVAVLSLFSLNSFAGDLQPALTSTSLSNNVSGTYFANNSGGGNNATMYMLSTGHSQGDKVYASGNFVSEIYVKDIAGTVFVSGDLITTELTYVSTAFDTAFDVL